MKKKLYFLTLVLILVVTLCSCSKRAITNDDINLIESKNNSIVQSIEIEGNDKLSFPLKVNKDFDIQDYEVEASMFYGFAEVSYKNSYIYMTAKIEGLDELTISLKRGEEKAEIVIPVNVKIHPINITIDDVELSPEFPKDTPDEVLNDDDILNCKNLSFDSQSIYLSRIANGEKFFKKDIKELMKKSTLINQDFTLYVDSPLQMKITSNLGGVEYDIEVEDNDILSVEKNLYYTIYPHKAGQTKITITASKKGYKDTVYEYDVIVSKKMAYFYFDNLNIDLEFDQNKEFFYYPIIVGGENVSLESSDTKIFEVEKVSKNSFAIKGKSVGNAVLILTSKGEGMETYTKSIPVQITSKKATLEIPEIVECLVLEEKELDIVTEKDARFKFSFDRTELEVNNNEGQISIKTLKEGEFKLKITVDADNCFENTKELTIVSKKGQVKFSVNTEEVECDMKEYAYIIIENKTENSKIRLEFTEKIYPEYREETDVIYIKALKNGLLRIICEKDGCESSYKDIKIVVK